MKLFSKAVHLGHEYKKATPRLMKKKLEKNGKREIQSNLTVRRKAVWKGA